MADLLEHRGPDDYGYLFLDSRTGQFQMGRRDFDRRHCDVSLGNRRLAIIDLSPAGAQPVVNETRDILCVFNGEIFNYIELRDQLLTRGHIFQSDSDSEVIVHAYEEWGQSCVEKFNGMWAFAIWDQQKQELFCSRDRFGIKPFYYFLSDDLFVFASEIKAILPALQQSVEPDLRVVHDFLVWKSLGRTKDTFFKNIKRLEPAQNLVVSRLGSSISQYWNYGLDSDEYTKNNAVETFRELLNDAVRLRLRSDVPVGVALSGGLDSSSLLACISNSGYNSNLKAFTAVFPGQRYDEQIHAELAAKELGAELHCVEYQPTHFLDDLQRVIWFLDYPAAEGQVVLRWRLMELASRHVKVMIEGQGADEMLAGYPGRYFMPFLKDEMERMHWINVSRMLIHRRRFYRNIVKHKLKQYLGLSRKQSQSLQDSPFSREFLGQGYTPDYTLPTSPFSDRLTRKMHADLSRDFLPMLLKYGDAFSMASSVESRLPFLDHRLVEFTFQLPYRYKYDGRTTKGILRKAMAADVPQAILSRTDKVGFETPLPEWILGSLDKEIRPILLSDQCIERGIFNASHLDRLLTHENLKNKRAACYDVFRWLSAELWFRQFIDDGKLNKPCS
jgi:asparagine synthase (glutamine-hydrolysing)